MQNQIDTITNEHVLEIRFKENPQVLDNRGLWAKEILTEMAFQEWQIVENRVDVASADQNERAFVSFKNAGFTAIDTPTRDFFPNRALKLLRLLFKLDGFGKELFVERLGVRSRFCTPYTGRFEELVGLFSTRYVSLTLAAIEAVGSNARLTNLGVTINFNDKSGSFTTRCGPMEKQQMSEFFKRPQESSNKVLPDNWLFYDFDYFIKPKGIMSDKDISTTVTHFSNEAWDRHEHVKKLILGV